LNITAVHNLTDDCLIAAMKQQYAVTNSSYSLFRRDKDILAVLYDEMVDRFRDQHLTGQKRDGKPTLREAFERAGWNYNAARKFRQRHENEKNLLPAYETSAKPLQLTAGELIKDEDGIEGVATHVHESSDKVDFTYKHGDGTVTETRPVYDSEGEPLFSKVKPAVRKVKVGDVFLLEDEGAEYVYNGDGRFVRTATPTLVQQKRDSDAKKLQEKANCLAAKAAEIAKKKAQRAEDARRRDEDKMANAAKAREELEALKAKRAADKAARAAAKASKKLRQGTTPVISLPAAYIETHSSVVVGNKSGPTAHGFFWEFRRHDKTPYVVRDLNNPHLGILIECPSKVAAEMMIRKYEQEAA
jgi:hypothetical protein